MKKKKGKPSKAEAPDPVLEIGGPGETEGQEPEKADLSWDEKFDAWMQSIEGDENRITIYACTPEKAGVHSVFRHRFRWIVEPGDTPPDLHEMGLKIGGGDFKIIARDQTGRKVFARMVYLGPEYNDLRDEAKALAIRAIPPAAPPSAPQGMDFGGLLEKVLNSPLAATLLGMFNPMNQARAFNKFGEDLARRNFDFNLETTNMARQKILDALEDLPDPRDKGDDSPEPVQGARTGPDWEDKISYIVDLLIEGGEKFVKSQGYKKNKMKNAILNDEDFQSLMRDPASAAATVQRLYKECGRDLVNKVLSDLGIKPPVAVTLNGHRPAAGAKTPAQVRK